MPNLRIAGLNNWGDYFSGNRKYPDVTVEPVAADITDLDQLAEHIEIFDTCINAKITAITNAYGGINTWLEGLDDINIDDNEPVILIPTGGKNQQWFINAYNGTTQYGGNNIWWVDLINDGANVIMAVCEDERAAYTEAVATLNPRPQIVGYPGAGIGWGRFACMKIQQALGVSCWMVDDRVHHLSQGEWGAKGNRIATCDELQKLQTALDGQRNNNWKHVLYSYPFTNSAVATYLSANYGSHAINGPSSFGVLKSLSAITFSRGFVFCKEDLSLHQVLENCVYDPKLVGDEDAKITSFVATDTHNPQYQNQALNEGALPAKKRNMINNLVNLTCFEVPTADNQGWRTLTWDILRDEYHFLNKIDLIKMQDAALYNLLAVILVGYTELVEKPSIKCFHTGVNAHRLRQIMTGIFEHW
ncbi:hypothetical protein C2869_00115 [Saccharobesus litoralis]|uniref:Uncharacterized protein n=1 Tax=Saccharobesus litoralis TaxID=2172099 RepID=A0A2S0VLF2_9ALTE|nr:hypothetical protein [Saccharobesus litoralis]AWB64940.1 hypothetical protein C2869_00115 [Saccharobesus litoralis]